MKRKKISKRIKKFFTNLKLNLSKKKENLKKYYHTKKQLTSEKVRKFYKDREQNIKEIRNFFLFVLFYGLVINYMLWAFFGINFELKTFPAFGLAFYFLTEEFIKFINRLRGR